MTKRRIRPAVGPTWDRPAGYFTKLMRDHDWPPGFVSQGAFERTVATSIKERERQTAEGIGWAGGTTVLPGTPKNARPAWMGRASR